MDSSQTNVDATSTDLASAQPLFDQKLIMNVDWSALGVPQHLLLTYGGIGTYRTFRDFIEIGYNPKVVAKADLPNSWNQLINSKYSGRVVVDLKTGETVWKTERPGLFRSWSTPIVVSGRLIVRTRPAPWFSISSSDIR